MSKTEVIINWLKQPLNLTLIAILLIGFLIRLKYLAVNSALWWDEAEYLNMARYWVFNIPIDINAQRTLLFPGIIALLYFLKFNEYWIRFFVELIPSTLTVLATYLVGKIMYNKKIGLIAAFIMSVFWLLIFNTTRVHNDAISLMFNLFAIYYFLKGFRFERKTKNFILSGLFISLGFMTRPISILIPIILFVFAILTKKLKLFKDKNLWILFISFIIFTIPSLIFNYIIHKNPFSFLENFFTTSGERVAVGFGWYILGFFKWYLHWFLFIFFIMGLIFLYKLIIGFDIVLKNKSKILKSDLFLLIWLLIPTLYFVFIQRAASDRWLLPISAAIFILTAKGINQIANYIKKYNKMIPIIFIILILLIGGYFQYQQTSQTINEKKDTYSQVRQTGEWIKSQTSTSDSIISNNVYMELTYSSERKVHPVRHSEEEMLEFFKQEKPKYYVVTGFYQSEGWTYTFPQNYPDILVPVQAYFFDEAQTQAAVVIYKINS